MNVDEESVGAKLQRLFDSRDPWLLAFAYVWGMPPGIANLRTLMINVTRIGLAAALLVSLAANAQSPAFTSADMHGAHANGRAFNGMVLNGLESNGMVLNGLVFNGLTFNGLTFNGWSLNGWSLNGRFLNGLKWNGARLNGIKWNGIKWNGLSANGWVLNGGLHPDQDTVAAVVATAPFYAWTPAATEPDWSALSLANVQVRLPAAP